MATEGSCWARGGRRGGKHGNNGFGPTEGQGSVKNTKGGGQWLNENDGITALAQLLPHLLLSVSVIPRRHSPLGKAAASPSWLAMPTRPSPV